MSRNRPMTNAIPDIAVRGARRPGRSWTDVLLISIWVAGYAAILTVFRFIKVLDTFRGKASPPAYPYSERRT